MTKWSEKHEKISQNQFGFQKGKSTVDCIFVFYSIITKVLHSGKKLYCCFLDYQKAFDLISRPLLWHKLLLENVSLKVVNAIKSMYSVVKSCIKYRSSFSDFVDSHAGVKQGDPGSPLMFMMFINDLEKNINSDIDNIFTLNELKLFILLYADDSVIFALSPESLQSMLNDVQLYCNTWGLKVNTTKTKIMIFEKGISRNTSYNFMYNDNILEVVNSFKYLGIHFFKNGKWFRTQKRIAQHASFALHNLFSIINQVELTTSEKCKLFDTLVSSVLNYSSEVWGFHEAKDIEIVHTKFCRKILCVKKSTNLTGLYGELGRAPLLINRKLNMIKYWLKIIKSKDNSLVKTIYLLLKNDVDNNNSYNGLNWAFQVKCILDQIGMHDYWLNQFDADYININLIKQRIFDIYHQSWYADINNSNRFETYSRFKHTFQVETYLNILLDKKFRISLSKFRLSSHNLAIERGRYENIPRNERKCIFCNLNVIESEYHLLLVCPFYIELRRKYFKPYFCHWPTLNKLDKLMASQSKCTILNLSKFIYFAFKKRDDA